MADGKDSFWQTLPGILTAVAGVIGALAALLTALHYSGASHPDNLPGVYSTTPIGTTAPPKQATGKVTDGGPSVMGQLESGINRQGMDFSAYAAHAENAPLCAEMCRTNRGCKAMTYVISQKTCWLKRGVPPAYPPGGPDYISSVKQ
jgi:hypothetical protein